MIKRNYFFGVLLLVALFFSCKKDDFDKYERPDWLTGKVFSQIKGEDDLKTFSQCLQMTGYDSIIDKSGSYTVFAPTDEAFNLYFSNHPKYKKVEDIPMVELASIVKFHIVQNPWSKQQLRQLDVNGWIDPEDEFNDKPRGYKRETLLLQKDVKYGVKAVPNEIDKFIIVDSTKGDWTRRVITDSRKFAPVFYSEYFSIYNLQFSDYTFYFGRTFDNFDDMFFVNAKITGDEIFAENGFIYRIDRVAQPLKNANEILRSNDDQYDYSKFLNLINQFPSFSYNQDKTFDQPGASEGAKVDSLFDLTYPELAFNINSEKTKAPASGSGFPGNVTIRFHHGIVAPTNAAFDEFVKQYVEGSEQWGSLDAMPFKIKRIIANTYFSENPVYETDIDKGYLNGESDIVRLDAGTIIQKEYASNCTYLGVNKAIIPRAFKSITGPIYRQRGYKIMMNAIEYSGLISALKKEGSGNMLFAVPDYRLELDSSLFYNYTKVNNIVRESFTAELLAPAQKRYIFSKNDIRLLLLNQVAVESPNYLARKEFLKTLAGNHLIWDNEKKTVRGTTSSSVGYQGSTPISLYPQKISKDTDNGETYSVDAFFRFASEEIYQKIKSGFPGFYNLMNKAGYVLPKEYRFTFISDSKIYTVFAPSDQALIDIQADTLTGKNLESFIKIHFVQDEMIFTDGKKIPGYYKTTFEISSEGGRKRNAEIYVEPGIDQIVIKGKNNNNYLTVNESSLTNMISARNLSGGVETNFPNIMSTGVIHKIDKALVPGLLDVK